MITVYDHEKAQRILDRDLPGYTKVGFDDVEEDDGFEVEEPQLQGMSRRCRAIVVIEGGKARFIGT